MNIFKKEKDENKDAYGFTLDLCKKLENNLMANEEEKEKMFGEAINENNKGEDNTSVLTEEAFSQKNKYEQMKEVNIKEDKEQNKEKDEEISLREVISKNENKGCEYFSNDQCQSILNYNYDEAGKAACLGFKKERTLESFRKWNENKVKNFNLCLVGIDGVYRTKAFFGLKPKIIANNINKGRRKQTVIIEREKVDMKNNEKYERNCCCICVPTKLFVFLVYSFPFFYGLLMFTAVLFDKNTKVFLLLCALFGILNLVTSFIGELGILFENETAIRSTFIPLVIENIIILFIAAFFLYDIHYYNNITLYTKGNMKNLFLLHHHYTSPTLKLLITHKSFGNIICALLILCTTISLCALPIVSEYQTKLDAQLFLEESKKLLHTHRYDQNLHPIETSTQHALLYI